MSSGVLGGCGRSCYRRPLSCPRTGDGAALVPYQPWWRHSLQCRGVSPPFPCCFCSALRGCREASSGGPGAAGAGRARFPAAGLPPARPGPSSAAAGPPRRLEPSSPLLAASLGRRVGCPAQPPLPGLPAPPSRSPWGPSPAQMFPLSHLSSDLSRLSLSP